MRLENEIFDELAALCTSPGYAHALAMMCFTSNIVGYRDELTPKDLQKTYSPNRLVRTEISTLLGLMIKQKVDLSLPSPEALQSYVGRTDALLKELHSSMMGAFEHLFDPSELDASSLKPFASGEALREPIFYGGESAYWPAAGLVDTYLS